MQATEPLSTYVSREFCDLAEKFQQTPEYLAFLILGDFAVNPPEGILIISRNAESVNRRPFPGRS